MVSEDLDTMMMIESARTLPRVVKRGRTVTFAAFVIFRIRNGTRDAQRYGTLRRRLKT